MPIIDDYKAIANAAKRLKPPVLCPMDNGIPGCRFLLIDGCPECPLTSYEDDQRVVADDMEKRYGRL